MASISSMKIMQVCAPCAQPNISRTMRAEAPIYLSTLVEETTLRRFVSNVAAPTAYAGTIFFVPGGPYDTSSFSWERSVDLCPEEELGIQGSGRELAGLFAQLFQMILIHSTTEWIVPCELLYFVFRIPLTPPSSSCTPVDRLLQGVCELSLMSPCSGSLFSTATGKAGQHDTT